MYNIFFNRNFVCIAVIFLIVSCDSHPTKKSTYINKNYDGFTIAEIEWQGTPLSQEIEKHAQLAKGLGLNVFIQITAQWCSPCKRLRAKTEEPLMKQAYHGTYIIRLDRDEWEQDFAEIGVIKTPLPIFWELGDDLKTTDYALNGNYWKEITPAALSPILKAYFSGRARQYLSEKPKANDL
ncbi:MAG: thioredoxin domain-containing protein [Kangiellaceae bacterium]